MLSPLFITGVAVCFGIALLSLVLVTRAPRATRQVLLFLLLAASIVFLVMSLEVIITGADFRLTLYRLTPELGFTFFIDKLAAFFLAVISVVSACVSVYSLQYNEQHGSNTERNLRLGLMSLFVLSMFLVVASSNTFSFLFFWELMSVTSFLLVLSERDKEETRKSGVFYFVMTQMSTAFLMFGFLAIYKFTGSFDIAPVSGIPVALKTAAFLALFLGFGIKAGVMPLHKWLPYAHSAAPSNISALMSGVMIKVAIYESPGL